MTHSCPTRRSSDLSPNDLKVAIAVREPSVVAYLVDVFERSWERARPFTSREASVMKDIAAEQRAMTLRMLIEGHSDPVSAKRLGVSPRTRSEEHTSELQSLMRTSYAVFCLK